MSAASNGNEHVIQFLLDNQADVNFEPALRRGRIHGRTAVFAAAVHGEYDTFSFLLARGARLNIPSSQYAIQWACNSHYPEMWLVMARAGVDTTVCPHKYGPSDDCFFRRCCGEEYMKEDEALEHANQHRMGKAYIPYDYVVLANYSSGD